MVGFLAFGQVFVAAPVVVVSVIAIDPVSLAPNLTLGGIIQELLVLGLIQIRLLRMHFGIQQDLLRYVQIVFQPVRTISLLI